MQPLDYIKRGCIFLMVSKMELKVGLKMLPKTTPAYHPLLANLPDEGFQIHSRHRHVHHYPYNRYAVPKQKGR